MTLASSSSVSSTQLHNVNVSSDETNTMEISYKTYSELKYDKIHLHIHDETTA